MPISVLLPDIYFLNVSLPVLIVCLLPVATLQGRTSFRRLSSHLISLQIGISVIAVRDDAFRS